MRLMVWQRLGRARCVALALLLLVAGCSTRPPMPLLNEFTAAPGDNALLDEDGEVNDWIELYNDSGQAIDLADWSLTDDVARPDKWRFPSLILAPQEYLIVFASGKDRREVDPGGDSEGARFLHTNFKLARESGFLALYPPTARRYLDGIEITYPEQRSGASYGRFVAETGAAGFAYFETASPGAPNGAHGELGRAAPVAFSHEHGLFDRAFTLALRAGERGATITYTLDGSVPDAQSAVYAGPIRIEASTIVRARAIVPGYQPSAVTTRSYLFPASVAEQPAHPAGFPQTWGTHQVTLGGYVAGAAVDADYAMDSRIVQDPVYGPQLDAALRHLPALSLVIERADWELYANPQDRGREAERPVSVEYFDPAGEVTGFQIDGGIRIQGGAGRWEFMPKHSFRLFFRNQYGASALEYPLFNDAAVDRFETLILRAGVDRSFAGHPATAEKPVDHRQATYLRDEWVRATQLEMSQTGVHGRFVHLYLNGLYWGIYNLVERPDADFARTALGRDGEVWASANHGGPVSGPQDRIDVMIRLAQEGGLADPDRYATMLEFVDPIQFSDYILLNWYAGNRDWPENNWYINVSYPAGRNYFYVWDAEETFESGAYLQLGGDGVAGAPYPNIIRRLFEALWENPEFRMLFADRMQRHLAAGGALSDDRSLARWHTLADGLAPAIVAESARWGDVRYDSPITPADWLAAGANVAAQFVGNADRLRQLARAAGYYPRPDPPLVAGSATFFEQSLTVPMTAATGTIYFTTSDVDPRAEGGAVSDAATQYTAPLGITQSTTVKARVLDGNHWSALTEVTFSRQGEGSNVRITELMYNPKGGDRFEFIEIANLGAISAELSNAWFRGIDYRFPLYTTLAPGQRWVVAADFGRFRQRYPEAEINGLFGGKLSNRGEEIQLLDWRGSLIDRVHYDDDNGWPLSADGAGDSLVLDNESGDGMAGANWRASEMLHGSPGE